VAKSSVRTLKKYGLREIHVHFGTFDFAINCIVGPFDGVDKYVAWKFEDDPPQWNGANVKPRGRYYVRDGYCPVVWIPRKPRTPREYGTLAHELTHAVRYMLFDWAGMPLTQQTDEAYCHSIGFAMTTILEALDRK